jgi:hypothetical protein
VFNHYKQCGIAVSSSSGSRSLNVKLIFVSILLTDDDITFLMLFKGFNVLMFSNYFIFKTKEPIFKVFSKL